MRATRHSKVRLALQCRTRRRCVAGERAEAVRVFVRAGENPGMSDACLHRDTIGFRCVRKIDGISAPSNPSPESMA